MKNILKKIMGRITSALALSLAAFAWPNTAQAEDLPEIKYTEPVYKTPGVPASGIDHWVTNSVTDYTVVTSSTTTWGESGETKWYVVTNAVEMDNGVTCVGDVRLVLCQGGSMSVYGYPGIKTTDHSLTIYGQPDGAGSLRAQGSDWCAGIGGSDYCAGGTVTINGGNVTAIGAYAGAGIGGCEESSDSGPITIAGGVVTAVAGGGAAALGFGKSGSGDASVTIVGGEVYLTGGAADDPFANNYGNSPTVFVADGYWTFDVPEDAIAAGRAVYPLSNSKYKCLVAEAGKTFVAQVGDYFYETFDAALVAAQKQSAATGSAEIRLVTDVSTSAVAFGNYAVNLELNGKTLTLSGTLSIAGPAGVLTVNDFSTDGSGKILAASPFTVTGGAKIALAGGNYNFDPTAFLAPGGYVEQDAGSGLWKVHARTLTANGVSVTTDTGSVSYDSSAKRLTLSGNGAYVATGTNTDGTVVLSVAASATTVTLDNLDIEDAVNSVVDFASGAHTLLFKGTNTLSAVEVGKSAIRVPTGVSVTIDAAAGCEVANAVLLAQGGGYAAAIGSAVVLDEDGDPEAAEGFGALTVAGGWIQACGGECAAAIGGGYGSNGGTIEMVGGVVEAQGGYYSAAIGTGYYGQSATLRFTGGEQFLTPGEGAPGIFQSMSGRLANISVGSGFWRFAVDKSWVVAGSKLYSLTGSDYLAYVAAATEPAYVAETGRAMYETFAAAAAAAKTAAEASGSAAITLVANATDVGADFGAYTIALDLNGKKLVLSDTLHVAAGGTLAVSDSLGGGSVSAAGGAFTKEAGATITTTGGTYNFDPTAFIPSADYGVIPNAEAGTWTVVLQRATVNGVTVTTTDGEIAFDAAAGVITLVRDGAQYVATGTNTEGTATIAVTADKATLKLKDFDVESAQRPVIDFNKDVALTILLEGTNVVSTSVEYKPAVRVENATRVTFDAAPGCALENAVLVAQGGYEAAAIGGGYNRNLYTAETVGEITIAGGWIQASGGQYAAAIGGAYGGSAGVITITGGRVEAHGGSNGAGVGGGYNGAGGEITITGGSVAAYGGSSAPGLGAGYYAVGGILAFEGDVYAEGGSSARPFGSYNWDSYDRGTIIVGKGSYGMEIESDLVAEGLMLYPCVAGSEYVCEVDVPGVKQAAVKASPSEYAVLEYYTTLAEAFSMAESDQAVVLYGPCAENVTAPAGKDVYFDGNGCGYSGTLTVGAGGSLYVLGGKFKNEPSPAWLPEGYHVLANKDADRLDYPYYVRYAAASVTREKTTLYYNSISEALRACSQGDVISVMNSGDVNEIAPAVPGIILDLNGCSITNTGTQIVSIQNVTFTIRDSVGGGRLVGAYNRAIYLKNGTLTVESGTIEGRYTGIYVYGSYNDKYTSTINVQGGTIAALETGYPSVVGAPYTHLNISGGSFTGYVGTYLESDAVIAQYATPNGMTRSSVDLTGYSGDTITLRVVGLPDSATPTPGIAFATGVAYSDSIMPADQDGNTGTAAFGGAMSFVYSKAAETWSVTAPPLELTWVDEDGLTPIPGIALDAAPKYSQITLPVVYREGKILTAWNGDVPQTTYTLGDSAMTFTASWATVPFSGSGSPTDPFRIANLNDLKKLAEYANEGGVAAQRTYVTFALTANIDVSSVENWTPIAIDGSTFWGAKFDGNGRAVSNLKCVGDYYLGLFGYLSGGCVQNLTVANVAVTNTSTETGYTSYRGAGAIAGWMANGAVVSNCTVSGSVFGNYNACSIAPSTDNTRIVDCDTTALKDEIDKAHTQYASYTTTNMCGWLETEGYSMDVIGRAKGNWVKTTFGNGGYVYKTYGLGDAKVTKKCVPMSGGKFTKFIYTVTAGTQAIVGGRIGLGSDVQVGDDDYALVSVIRDSAGEVMGLRMVCQNEGSAIYNDQYNLYFRGVAGCTDATTYWFGGYWGWESNWMNQLDQSNALGDYRFDENGEYEMLVGTDSGLALSWEVNLEPGKTATYACAFGIGEKADPPRWYTDLTLSKDGRTINADAKVTNEAGLKVMLYGQCAPDKFGGEKLFDTQRALGEDAPIDMHAGIDTTGWADGLYVFTFWTVNEYGAMSESKRKPIQIKDGELILDIGGEGYYLIEGEVVSEDKEQFSDYAVKVVALGDSTTEYPSVITKDGYFYAVTPKGEYNVIVTATPSDPTLQPVESIVLVHVENDTQDVRMELSNPSTRSINSKLVDKTAPSSQFHGFLVGDLEQVALKLGETEEGDFTLKLTGWDDAGTSEKAQEMRVLGVRGSEFRDIAYVNFAFSVSNETAETALAQAPRTATVVLPFLYARSGELEVYRWNDTVGAMEVITAEPNAAGEYFEVYSDDAVLVRIVKGGLYGLAYNLDRHLTVDGIDIGIAQGLGWTCVSNELVFTGSGEYLWRGTNDVPLKSVNVGGAYIQFTSGETQVSITNVATRPTWLPQGYGWNWDPTTQIGTSYEFDPVAKIVVDKDYPNLYETLDEAVSAADADGRSVVVLRDCAFTALNVSGGRTVTLEGGLTTVTGTLAAITVEAGSTLRVISGTYTFDPTIHVPEGYGVTDNHDGTWTVWGAVKLTLIGNGETDPETNFFNIVSGDNLEGVPTPVSTNGLDFVAWYRDAACKQKQLAEKPIYDDMTLYAGWGCEVTFNAAGGKFEDGSDVKVETIFCGSLTFPAVTRDGYTLLGWYNAITNGATEITVVDRPCKVYARWSADKKPAGGTGYTGTDTPDGGGVEDVKPTGKLPTGDIAIPERVDNTATGKAIVSIARGAYTPKQYEKAFSAPAIKSVSIPMYVTEIGDYAFYGNTELKKVVFAPAYNYKTGAKAEVYIRNQAFANTAITNVTFPVGGAYKLGHLAFADNAQLKDVWLLGDVTIESLDNAPFRGIGAACGGTTFHLSPKKAADAEFVKALTNGVNMATVQIDEDPAGTVELAEMPTVTDTQIIVTFTLSENAPWKTVTTDTVSLLYSTDPEKLVTASDCKKIPATLVEKQADGSYRAEFAKPEGDMGYFTVCVGD